jgi:hypothetical protein
MKTAKLICSTMNDSPVQHPASIPLRHFYFNFVAALFVPAGFTAQQCLTGSSNLCPRPVSTKFGKTATAISGQPPQNFNPTDKALRIIVNTCTKPEHKLGAAPLTESLVVRSLVFASRPTLSMSDFRIVSMMVIAYESSAANTADIWQLGILTDEMLFGSMSFDNENKAKMLAAL